ncbi:MAG: nucleoid-structuring protein H-NS [Bacteroidia bacterium]|nr:nucleoid-structuring protein H-NS [Bacteroidia bacterium]
MMLPIRNSSKLIMLALVLITAFGCQSKKKAMQARNAAIEKAKMEQEAVDRKLLAEEKARKAAEEQARREAEQRANETNATAPSVKLGQYFGAIAGSTSVSSANTSINEALTLFASPETPVLIVISESGGMKDYDKPTTIKQYLNYLKDQKKNPNTISDIKTNGAGKITELELKKN